MPDLQDSSLASVVVGTIQVLFTAVAALIMDRAGRKPLLALSGEPPGSKTSFTQLWPLGGTFPLWASVASLDSWGFSGPP